MTNPPALVVTATPTKYYEVCRKISCPLFAKSVPPHSPLESEWSDEDWNGDRQRECEKKKKEQQKKEEEEKQKRKDYCPPTPIYDPTHKEDTPAPIMNRKDLDSELLSPKL